MCSNMTQERVSPVHGCSSLKKAIPVDQDDKYKQKPKLILEPLQTLHHLPLLTFRSSEKDHLSDDSVNLKQKSIFNEELLHNLKQNAKMAVKQKQAVENLVQVSVDNANSVSDSFRYQERFMKQAITGIF